MIEIRVTGIAVRAAVAAAYLGLLAACAPTSKSVDGSTPQGATTAAPAGRPVSRQSPAMRRSA